MNALNRYNKFQDNLLYNGWRATGMSTKWHSVYFVNWSTKQGCLGTGSPTDFATFLRCWIRFCKAQYEIRICFIFIVFFYIVYPQGWCNDWGLFIYFIQYCQPPFGSQGRSGTEQKIAEFARNQWHGPRVGWLGKGSLGIVSWLGSGADWPVQNAGASLGQIIGFV